MALWAITINVSSDNVSQLYMRTNYYNSETSCQLCLLLDNKKSNYQRALFLPHLMLRVVGSLTNIFLIEGKDMAFKIDRI